MNFEMIIGNPPYQGESDSTRKPPIYHFFYDVTFEISNKVSLITPGRFLYKVGQAPKAWMERMLSDKHLNIVDYYQKTSDVFDDVEIKGGVAITYRDINQNYGPIGFFSEFNELRSILKKVRHHKSHTKVSFSDVVSSQGIYKFSDEALRSFPRIIEVQGKGTASKITSNSLENLSEIFLKEPSNDTDDYIQILGLNNRERELRCKKRTISTHSKR